MIRRALSGDQERQWLVDRLLDNVAAADDPTVVRLHGPLSMAAVHHAWVTLAARHDSLRTHFPTACGTADQCVIDGFPSRLPITLIDLSAIDPPAETELGRAIDTAARRPFDISAAPPWRVLIVRMSPDDHILALTLHHLIADLWSVAVVIDEFCSVYDTAVSGEPVRLGSAPAQPIDLADSAVRRLTPRRVAALDAWWREHLRGAQTVDLPTAAPRQHLPRLSSRVHEAQLAEAPAAALRVAAKEGGTTLLPVLLAAFAAVVARWSSASDITVVSVSAGRRGRNSDRTVGLLTECLVLRVRTDGDPPFLELVRRSADVVMDALDHVALPFVELVSITDPARDREPSPLRQLGLSLHNVPATMPRLPTISAAPTPPTPPRAGTSEADIWMEVFERGDGPLGLRLQMDDHLFSADDCAAFAQAFTAVLDAATRNRSVQLSELPIDDPPPRLPSGFQTVRPAPAPPDTETVDTETVNEVVRAVSDVLRLGSRPAADDNFFLLGGRSIDMSRLAALLADRLGVDVDLYDLMTAPTMVGVARAVEAGHPSRRHRIARAEDGEAGDDLDHPLVTRPPLGR